MSRCIWNGHWIDVPIYTNLTVQNEFCDQIYLAARKGHTEIVKILAPFPGNPNAPHEDGETPISRAVIFGHTEILKILVPLTDNQNAANKNGLTAIHDAACNGHAEIVKILVPLTDNPNTPN